MKATAFGTKAAWKLPGSAMKALRDTAHAHALRYEPTPQFPGVDIDAIHYKLGAVKAKKVA